AVWVDTNGRLGFVAPGASDPANTATPAPATVDAFWDDLVVDASASVRTAVLGTAPNRQFVVEWHDVALAGDPAQRLSAGPVVRAPAVRHAHAVRRPKHRKPHYRRHRLRHSVHVRPRPRHHRPR